MKSKILILCSGNSCRSQMAEGFLKNFDPELEVYSAGTKPANKVDPRTITVMNEVGIDIHHHHPKSMDMFLDQKFDYVITVCDDAKEACPFFPGQTEQRIHKDFPDPAKATGSEDETLAIYRNVRDEIREWFFSFYQKQLK